MLQLQTKITVSDAESSTSQILLMTNKICHCVEIRNLMFAMDIVYVQEDWRLFIDSSVTSLKAIFLHNDFLKPSLPVTHSPVAMKQWSLLDHINYNEHKWAISRDLEVIGLLLGLQKGYKNTSAFSVSGTVEMIEGTTKRKFDQTEVRLFLEKKILSMSHWSQKMSSFHHYK